MRSLLYKRQRARGSPAVGRFRAWAALDQFASSFSYRIRNRFFIFNCEPVLFN